MRSLYDGVVRAEVEDAAIIRGDRRIRILDAEDVRCIGIIRIGVRKEIDSKRWAVFINIAHDSRGGRRAIAPGHRHIERVTDRSEAIGDLVAEREVIVLAVGKIVKQGKARRGQFEACAVDRVVGTQIEGPTTRRRDRRICILNRQDIGCIGVSSTRIRQQVDTERTGLANRPDTMAEAVGSSLLPLTVTSSVLPMGAVPSVIS